MKFWVTCCLAPHLFKWIPVQTMNGTVCQCHHHITWRRHCCGNRQFGCCDAHHRGWGHEVGLMLPQLQKQTHETFMNDQDTAVTLASKELMIQLSGWRFKSSGIWFCVGYFLLCLYIQHQAVKEESLNLTFRRPCIVIYSYNKSQYDALFLKFILIKNST